MSKQPPAAPIGQTDVAFSHSANTREFRYRSGNTVYVESFDAARLLCRAWSDDGRAGPAALGQFPAFEIRVKTEPSPADVPGTLLADGWKFVSAEECPAPRPGQRACAVTLEHPIGLTVAVQTLLDGTPVIARCLRITNRSAKAIAVTGLAPLAGRLWNHDTPVALGHMQRWELNQEHWFGWTELQPGTTVIDRPNGVAADNPFFVLRNDATGQFAIGELAWPVNYRFTFDRSENGVSFRLEATAVDALRVLDPGESFITPAVHMGLAAADFDVAVQSLHEHVRRSLRPDLRPDLAYRSQYLCNEDWPMCSFRGADFDEAHMLDAIDVAHAAGIEVFILDSPTWCSVYGDWLVPDPKRFPRGLAPLVEHAHAKGMLFGLYTESEGGRDGFTSPAPGCTIGPWSDSAVGREHPEWLSRQPRPVLDLTIPAAAEYWESEIARIIDHYHLDLFRHDFNDYQMGQRASTIRSGFAECDYFRHYEALYAAVDRVRESRPNVVFQQACTGGDRTELSFARRFHEHFTTDRSGAPWVYRMAAGISTFLPPEILVTCNGMAWPHDLADLDTTLRGAYCLGNTPMLFHGLLPRHVKNLTPAVRDKFLHYADLYKSFIRPLLPTCKVFHHAPVNATGGVEPGEWFAMEFISPDRGKAWAVIIRIPSPQPPADATANPAPAEPSAYVFKPKGLGAARSYRVTFDNAGATESVAGASLASAGLRIAPVAPACSELLLFEAL